MLENGNKDTICMFFTAFRKPPVRYYLNHTASHTHQDCQEGLSVKSQQRKMTKSLAFLLGFQVSLQSQKLHVKLYTYSIEVTLYWYIFPVVWEWGFIPQQKLSGSRYFTTHIEFKLGGFIFMTCYTFTFHFIDTYRSDDTSCHCSDNVTLSGSIVLSKIQLHGKHF
jgi:hypothetical protein